jgi:hypothetical protein
MTWEHWGRPRRVLSQVFYFYYDHYRDRWHCLGISKPS